MSTFQVRSAVANQMVRIFCVCMSQPIPSRSRTPEGVGPGDLARLVASSGERFFDLELDFRVDQSWPTSLSPSLREGLDFASHGLQSMIDDNYLVALGLAAPLDKTGKLDLQVVDDSGRRDKHVQLLYPQELVPCEPQ